MDFEEALIYGAVETINALALSIINDLYQTEIKIFKKIAQSFFI